MAIHAEVFVDQHETMKFNTYTDLNSYYNVYYILFSYQIF